ncbi:type III secretion system translocon subunit VopD [Vibrio parahaemolyticus]|nr:type III secretion system translocon subunit VopD [Vibrio parahaemolyticus]EGR3459499.1 translocator protein PopD [Vibrio parahaemolyticus]EJC7186784.1 type III secretion system translocon subunit VopD [Vibrio parahaemolyticus]EJG0061517.1 type III secretion system translocon subunit VopD [Vibrio parahaemolyticus]EJG0454178.1 type III secretion system translocon subunit VopD [Vibrio parahaemolyticus]
MLDKIGNTGRADLYGLGELGKTTKAEKAPETKTEAAAIRGNSEAAVSGPKPYQLDGPKAPAIGDQARVVEKLMSALAPTVNLVMQTLEKAVNSQTATQSSSNVISESLALITLLYQVSKLSREQQALERDIAVEANVASLKSQAEELNNSAKAMIAMAVVSGVLAGVTAVLGGVGSFKAGKQIKGEVAANKLLKTQKAGLDKVDDLLSKGGLAKAQQQQLTRAKNAGQETVGDLSSKLTKSGRKFDKATAANQARNSVLQSLGQMANSASSVEQTKAQARSKEDEVAATRAQAAKQKADENISFQDSMLKELRDLFRSISDSQNQAWRASIPTV